MTKKMTKKQITEKDNIHQGWYKEAKEVRSLQDFINLSIKLNEEYEHDYGTICHAISALGIAAMWYADRCFDHGGITGFQAGCIMWSTIQHWMGEEGPMQLLKYEQMLYPQYEQYFEKTISKDTMKWLQERAQKLLKDGFANSAVKQHWESLAEGIPPFGYVVKED